jgi:ketosteroid isomerase-like protein
MRNRSVVVLLLAVATPAFADATAEAKKHDEAFAKACNAGDVKAVMTLYPDEAFVIWPDVGEEARGKAGIEKLVTNLCNPKLGTEGVLKDDVGAQLETTHIAILGHWELTQNGPDGKPATSRIRTSEIIVKSAGGWRYVVDHASVGTAPAAPAN